MTQRALVPLVIDMESKQKIIAVVAVLIVVVAAVAAVMMTKDKDDGGSADPVDTYYFYFDGFDEKINGWHVANGSDIMEAFDSAMKADGIPYKVDTWGGVTISDYINESKGQDSDGNYLGVGTGIFLYTSTDVTNYNQAYNYFALGPVLSDITSNIVYFSYGDYKSGVTTYHSLNPTETDSDITAGDLSPFRVNSDYKPLDYSGKYYFYLDGYGEEIDGWYASEGKDIMEAFDAAMKDGGISYTNDGLLIIEDHINESKGQDLEGNYIGVGTGIFLYSSTDRANYNQSYNYFVQGPPLGDVTSNIVYISYGDYKMGATTYYAVNPTETTADLTVGDNSPFKA